MTRAERAIRWCEDHIHLPVGQFVGQPLKLAGFMRDDFRAIFDNVHGTRLALISRGRKNSNTTECAFIGLLYLCGPEAKVNSKLYSCAQSRDQAAVLFDAMAQIVRLSPKLQGVIQIRETAKELLCPQLGTFYKALSAEVSTAYGLNPRLVIFDELGQVKGPMDPLFEAMMTSTATQIDPLAIAISTQASDDQALFSQLIDDALAGHDPRVVLRLDTAPVDADPFSEKTIRLANPAYDVFMNKKEVLAMAAEASRMPAREASYKNLVLNMRVESSSPFISPVVWAGCGGEPIDFRGKGVFVGLDLSETSDLTSAVFVHHDTNTGLWHVRPFFWLPGKTLRAKSAHDRVSYDLWYQQGYLEVTPGASISYEFLAERLREIFDDYEILAVGYDPWGFGTLRPCLVRAGFSERELERFVKFVQGTKSMSPALRELESLVLDSKLRHGNHPVLSWNANNATTEGPDASNRKLSKRRSSGRIDGLVALVMAIGVAPVVRKPVFDVLALLP